MAGKFRPEGNVGTGSAILVDFDSNHVIGGDKVRQRSGERARIDRIAYIRVGLSQVINWPGRHIEAVKFGSIHVEHRSVVNDMPERNGHVGRAKWQAEMASEVEGIMIR